MKIKKICFVIPNTAWFDKRYWHNIPYTEGLMIAVAKRAGYEVTALDANIDDWSATTLAEKLAEQAPDVMAVSAMTIEYKDATHQAFAIARQVNPDVITIMGGVYPTLTPEIAARDANVDFIIRGEGEERFPALLRAIEAGGGFDKVDGLIFRAKGQVTVNPVVSRVEDLNAVPFPDYTLFEMPKYTNYGQKFTQNFQFRNKPWCQTITSRGCPFNCIFCASNRIYGLPVRYRSAANVLAEVDWLVKEHGIRELLFVDDSFLQSKKRAIEIFQGLIERRYDLLWKSNNLSIFLMDDELLRMMKDSGCYQITVSIESGCQRTLDLIRKPINLKKIRATIEKIKNMDIELISNFVIGFPGETWEDIRECFRYAEEIDVDYALFSIATPLPATELLDICLRERCLPPDFDVNTFNYYGFGRGVISTSEFSPFELQVLRAFEWDRINFKTPERCAKIAGMLGITLAELDAWRKETRRMLGVQVQMADKRA